MPVPLGIVRPQTNDEILLSSQEAIRNGALLGPTGGSWDNFAMSVHRDTSIGQLSTNLMYRATQQVDTTDNYDWNVFRDGDLEGYEEHLEDLINVRSPGQLEVFKHQVDVNRILSSRLKEGDAFWSRLASGIIDPVNLIPVPGSRGIGVIRGLLRAGKGGAAISAVSEGGRALIDPTVTPEELALNITGGAVISGALGGLVGGVKFGHLEKAGVDYMRITEAQEAGSRIDEVHPGMSETIHSSPLNEDGTVKELNEWIERGTNESSQDYFKRLDELGAMPELLKEYKAFSEVLDADAFMPAFLGAEKWRIKQLPYFMLKNTKFKGKVGNSMRRLADMISGSPGTFNKRDAKFGAEGHEGSAHSSAMQAKVHNGIIVDARDKMFRAYVASTGADPDNIGSQFWTDVKMTMKARKNKSDVNPKQQFDRDTLSYYLQGNDRTVNNRDATYLGAVKDSAEAMKTYFDYMAKQGIDAEVFGVRRFRDDIAAGHERIAEIEADTVPGQEHLAGEKIAKIRDQIEADEIELKAIEDANARGEMPRAPGQDNAIGHFPRLPIKQIIQDRRQDLIDIIEGHYGLLDDVDTSLNGFVGKIMDDDVHFKKVLKTFTKTLKANEWTAPEVVGKLQRIADARASSVDELAVVIRQLVYNEGWQKSILFHDAATLQNIEKTLKTVDKLGAQANKGMLTDIGVSGSMRERDLDIPTEKIMEFMEQDLNLVMQVYHRGMAPGIEISRNFGDVNMKGELERMAKAMDDDMIARGLKGRDLEEMIKEKEDMLTAATELRDKVLGIHMSPEDPSSWSNRTIQTTKNWMTMALMGKAVVPALADIGRIAMSVGLRRTAGAALDKFASPKEFNIAAREVKLAGEAAEMALRGRFEAMFDISAYTPMHSAFERGVAKGVDYMFIANMLSVYTDAMKRFSGGIIQSEMLLMSERVANGKVLNRTEKMWMSRAGFSREKAIAIHEQWKRASPDGAGTKGDNLYLANTEQWDDDQLVRFFRTALATEINNAVITPGHSTKLNFMSSGIGSLMTQFKSFSLESTFRTLMSGMQMRDARAFNGALSMVALGGVVGWWKSPTYDDRGLVSADRLIQAVDYSGVTGLLFEMDNMLETVTGQHAGIRPMLGIQTLWGNRNIVQQYGQAGGPVVSLLGDLIWSFSSDDAEGDDKARAVRRLVPWNNLVWWDGLVDQLQRAAGKALED